MKEIGLFQAMSKCKKYSKEESKKREEIKEKRFREIVQYAKENSPYFQKLYENIPDNWNLRDLPTTNKRELMEHFNEWVTDPNVKLADLRDYMEDSDHIGRWYQGKYMIFTTSGSTGEPLVSICDKSTNNVMGAIGVMRSYARKEDMKAFIRNGKKTIGVFANEGFYLGNSSVRNRQLTMPWKRKQMEVTSALYPTERIVKELNAFQPTMLGGYPSNLELLVEEQLSGRLQIHPVIIMTGGEFLSDDLRERLSEAFQCYVQTSYSCTEGGTIACECTQRHFHINDDWVKVEAVDSKNKPVKDGVLSDKILLTNYFNKSQPFIRYEVTDRVIMSHEQCPCGNPSPWLQIEGRTDDILIFEEDGESKRVAPLAVYATLKEIHAIRRFQVIENAPNRVELRLVCKEGEKREEVMQEAVKRLQDFFATQNVNNVEIVVSELEPKQNAGSGKFKHVYNACKG